jgi:UDP-perosamine 4-acetyltransferase
MVEVLVWGAGGHGRVVADLARALGHEVAGYTDADPSRADIAETDMLAWLEADGGRVLALGVGDNTIRLARARALPAARLPALAHPAAVLGSGIDRGAGSVVLAGAVLNTGASLGMAVIVNTAAVIEHDVEVGDGAHVSPGAVVAGGASVGVLAWVGANATVLPGVRVGEGAIVGAGAVVVASVPPGVTVAGVPARRLR